MTPDLPTLEALARAAGALIMDVRNRSYEVETKSDASPVTEADRQAEDLILSGLRDAYPNIPIVAEEESAAGLSPDSVGDRFFLVDPLDGTREFISGNTDFTVNIALINKGEPVMGVVFVPATGTLFSGAAKGATKTVGEKRAPITSCKTVSNPRVVASRSHRTDETNSWIEALGSCEIVSVGSSLKFCLLAEGSADFYPRFGRTMEWDTAAGDAVLRAAGGMTYFTDGTPFHYGKKPSNDAAFANPNFIATGYDFPDVAI